MGNSRGKTGAQGQCAGLLHEADVATSSLFVNDHQDIRSFLHCLSCSSSRPSA